MDKLGGPQQLVEDVALVNVLQQSALADDRMQVSVWGACESVTRPGGEAVSLGAWAEQAGPYAEPPLGHLSPPTARSSQVSLATLRAVSRTRTLPSGPRGHLRPAHCLGQCSKQFVE